jgi:hypothetical protein
MTEPIPTNNPIDYNSAAVLNYLTTLQGVITRLATNSSSCKTLCVTLVSAIAVIITQKTKPEYAWIASIPILSLGLLDAYYLGLENGFRRTYNQFTQSLIKGTAQSEDLFKVSITASYKRLNTLGETLCALYSPAIWLFYGSLSIVVYLGRNLIFS